MVVWNGKRKCAKRKEVSELEMDGLNIISIVPTKEQIIDYEY